MDKDELNRSAAKVLGWEQYDTSHNGWMFAVPDEVKNYWRFSKPSDMHFHDSYDWAMLGLKELSRRNLENVPIDLFYMMEAHVLKAPAQITEAWLEVLENE